MPNTDLSPSHRAPRRPALLLVFFLAVALLAAPAAAQHTKKVARHFELASDGLVELDNLAGTVQVIGGAGRVEIEATIHAENARLADELEIRFDQRGDALRVVAEYPGKHRSIVYPGEGRGWGRSEVEYQGRRMRIYGGGGRGVELWVDVVLRLPAGVEARVRNRVGTLVATGYDNDLLLDAASGDVEAEEGRGDLRADTGSGDVTVKDHRGAVDADTGSGDVRLRGVFGDVRADTGSGDVELVDVIGGRILADTDSGDVVLRDVKGEIEADTGSGEVKGRGLVLDGPLIAATGSGRIDLEGDFTGVTRIVIDTGSGGAQLRGTFPGLDLDLSAGSGTIQVDLPDVAARVQERDRFVGTSRGGGVPVEIDTGSGGVILSAG